MSEPESLIKNSAPRLDISSEWVSPWIKEYSVAGDFPDNFNYRCMRLAVSVLTLGGNQNIAAIKVSQFLTLSANLYETQNYERFEKWSDIFESLVSGGAVFNMNEARRNFAYGDTTKYIKTYDLIANVLAVHVCRLEIISGMMKPLVEYKRYQNAVNKTELSEVPCPVPKENFKEAVNFFGDTSRRASLFAEETRKKFADYYYGLRRGNVIPEDKSLEGLLESYKLFSPRKMEMAKVVSEDGMIDARDIKSQNPLNSPVSLQVPGRKISP